MHLPPLPPPPSPLTWIVLTNLIVLGMRVWIILTSYAVRCTTTTILFQKVKFDVMQPLVYFSFSRWLFQNHSLIKNIRPNGRIRGYSWKKIWKTKRAVLIRMLNNLFGKNNCASSYNHLIKGVFTNFMHVQPLLVDILVAKI